MKICFFLQRRFVFIGHAMALNIKKVAPETEFCAMVQYRPGFDFIRNQKEIPYTSTIFEEDIYASFMHEEIDYDYLRNLEKEYGIPNLWPYLYFDRIVMNGQFLREYPHNKPTLSRDDMLRHVQSAAKAVIAFLEKEKPDAVVFSVIGSVASTLLYHIAKKKGIQTVNMEFARIGNRIAFSEDDMTFTWTKKRFDEIQAGRASSQITEAKKFLDEFRSAPAPYDASYMKEFYGEKGRLTALRFLQPARLLRSIPWHLRTLISDVRKIRKHDYNDIFIWWALWDKLKRIIRTIIGFSDLYDKPNWSERFAYFPLHIEPEIAIMRYAPYHTNQLEIIRTIARALPIDMYLYVKEHPGMVGYRPRAYYKEILNIPNVRLISPNVPGSELSRRAAITTVITSTAAWEALLCNKPSVTFGGVFFNDLPGVVRCYSFEDLPYIIKKQLEEWKPDEKVLLNYIAALLEDSVSANFQAMWNDAASLEEILKDSGMVELSHVLAEKIGVVKPA